MTDITFKLLKIKHDAREQKRVPQARGVREETVSREHTVIYSYFSSEMVRLSCQSSTWIKKHFF